MKIEKLSETQIQVTLNHSDLTDRDLKISELAYGSKKAQALFKDMMARAYEDFGFETDNVPLMIEAVPLSADSIMIVVTKVEDPSQIEQKLEAIGETQLANAPQAHPSAVPEAPLNFRPIRY